MCDMLQISSDDFKAFFANPNNLNLLLRSVSGRHGFQGGRWHTDHTRDIFCRSIAIQVSVEAYAMPIMYTYIRSGLVGLSAVNASIYSGTPSPCLRICMAEEMGHAIMFFRE